MNDITADDIKELRDEAGTAGDLDQVALCDAALDGNPEAIVLCEQAIASARDMNLNMSNPAPAVTWTVWASSGEYTVEAANVRDAYDAFVESHGDDDPVAAITCDAMSPRLVLAEEG